MTSNQFSDYAVLDKEVPPGFRWRRSDFLKPRVYRSVPIPPDPMRADDGRKNPRHRVSPWGQYLLGLEVGNSFLVPCWKWNGIRLIGIKFSVGLRHQITPMYWRGNRMSRVWRVS